MRMHSLVVLALSTLSLIAARPHHHHHHHHHHHTTPHTEAALVDVTTTATVYLAGDGLANVVMGVEDPNGDAYGRYTESVESTGWGVLNVVATSKSHDFDAMFAVGYLEGYITAPRIYQSYVNTFAGIFKSTSNFTIPQKLVDFEQTNIDWMRQQIIKNWKNDRYWFEAGGIMAQLDGLLAGYNAASPPSQQLSYMEMYLLSQDGDMEDLHFLIPKDEINPEFKARGDSFRCSSLVKLAPGNSDLYVGHDTWDGYGNMLRVYKHYDFDLQTLGRRRVSFSGYFAWLSSVDDWYINHNNLVITETTNGFRDKSLENLIVPTTVLSWIRCMIATYAAATGPDWHWYFSRYNSGTYNNQWIIVDMKLFTPNGTTLVPNTLTISESLPGYFETADVTQYLQTNTYWASYNVPYFPDIYNKSGFSQPNEWATAPRAQIFRRDQGKITNFQQFQDMMNYNDYKNDPISKLSPTAAIAARGDLATRPRAFGAVDMKVTSSQLSSTLTSIVRSGPSTSNNRLPPFEWTDTFNSTVHIGQPQLFNFTTIQVTPYAYGL